MCSGRAVRFGVALVFALPAARGDAQARDDAYRHLVVLSRAAADAEARLRAYDDSVANARRAMELVSVGPFRLRVQPDLRDLATRAATLAQRELEPSTGRALDLVARREMVVRRETVLIGFPRQTIPSVVVAILDGKGVERMPVWGPVESPALLASWLRQEAHQVLVGALPRETGEWLGGVAMLDSVATGTWLQLRLQLVSSPATIARQCFDGTLAACSKLLGLTPTADPVLEWFDAKDRRLLVEREKRVSYRRAGVARTDACLGGSDTACISLLETGELSFYTYLPGHRVALLQRAIQMGGVGAIERLYTGRLQPAERLSLVAGVPADSVVRDWLERIRGTPGSSEDLTPAIGAMSLLWVGLFGILALRSTRWR